MKRFVSFASKSDFTSEKQQEALSSKSLVFIEETCEIWVKGKYYGLSTEWQGKITTLETAVEALKTALGDDTEGLLKDFADLKTQTQSHINNKSNPHEVTKTQVGLSEVTNDAQVKRTEMGVASGVATLDANGLIPTSQLPSFVDDVLEFDSKTAFPAKGETGKIYVATDTNLTYRWSGTAYIEISASLALGETSSTAYAGDKGKATTDKLNEHVADKNNPHEVTKAQVGLGNVDNTSDADKPVSTAQATAIADAKKAGTDALQSISKGTDGAYVTTEVGTKGADKTQTVAAKVTVQEMATADASHKGLAEASDVKAYLESEMGWEEY